MPEVTAYYSLGVALSGDWSALPAWDVQAVAWRDPLVGADFCYGRSYFFPAPWLDGQIVSADWGGLADFLRGTHLDDVPLLRIRPSELVAMGVKFGRTISSHDFSAIVRRIRSDFEVSGQFAHRKPDRVLV